MQIVRVGYGHPDAMRLIEEVQAEYTARYGSPDVTPLDPLMFEPPSGSFFVGYLDGVPVASGAWRAHADRTTEIKRMYVAASARGKGLARTMLAHLESTAKAMGAGTMVLETGTAQPEAIGLYESAGYKRIEPFGLYRDSPLNRCFGKAL